MQRTELPIDQRMELYNRAMELRKEKRWSFKRIAKELDINENTVGGWLYKGCVPNTRYIFPDLNKGRELSYVLGVFYGDGYASKSKNSKNRPDIYIYRIGLKVVDKDFVVAFRRDILAILTKDDGYPIYAVKKRGQYSCEIRNRMLYEFMKKPLEEHKPFIEKYPASFLRGFYDSEGNVHNYVGKTGACHQFIRVSNTNLSLLLYVQNLLASHFSIFSHLTVAAKRGYINFLNGRKVVLTKDCYSLGFGHKNDVLKFYKEIGFSIKRKQDKLAAVERISNA
jgi:hypothetical protein